MIKPTIGRVVWFWPSITMGRGEQPYAALVAHVWSDTLVNLAVADQNGFMHSFTSVQLIQDGEPRPDSHFCEWMPYQIGQAKKEESK